MKKYNVTLTQDQLDVILKALDSHSAAPTIVDVEGDEIDTLRACISGDDVYRVRVALDGGVKIKTNEEMWTHPIGSAPYRAPAVLALRQWLATTPPVSAALAAMLDVAKG